MKHWKPIAIGVASIALAGTIALQPTPITLNTATASKVIWDKPSTDAGWAEDVKRENFDIKSTRVLDEMITAHTEKLKRQQEAFAKYDDMQKAGQDPVQYLYWEKRDELKQSYPDMSEQELHAETQNAAQTKYNQMLWEIEKLQQSIERMNKEVELRDKGFVIVEGTETGLLGGTRDPRYIRYIHD